MKQRASTQNLEKVKAGTYSVTVIDSNPHGAVSTSGTVMVEQPDFVCGRDSLMDLDGFKYPTVSIGNQCWTVVNIGTFTNQLGSRISEKYIKKTWD